MKDTLLEFISQKLLNGYSDIQLTTDYDLLSTGLIDSMAMMRLVAFIEEKTSIQVPPEDILIENFINVKAILKYLEKSKLK